MWGNIVALFSAVAFAMMILTLRRQRNSGPFGSIIIGNGATFLLCMPWILHSKPPPEDWIWLGLLGVFQLGLSYACFAVAIRRVSALQAVMIPIIEPVLNPLWTFLFIGERPGRWALPGGVIVIAAVVVRSLRSLVSQTPSSPPHAACPSPAHHQRHLGGILRGDSCRGP